MKKINAAIIGFGNIGKAVFDSLESSKDFNIAGIVRNNIGDGGYKGYKVVKNIDELQNVDVAVLTAPSRKIKELAVPLLKKGIRTVDSFDIHSEIVNLREDFDKVCKESGSAALISCGWDPGSDSVVRALLLACVPKGITYTNFGEGMSMGHTVCVKAIAGVKDAMSVTIPKGNGLHRRMVYVELENGASFDSIEKNIKTDPYFCHDETYVKQVECVDDLKDMGHGVNIFRKGTSGSTPNQLIDFNMKINNPALTGEILVAAARAVMLQKSGAYTMIEIAPIDFLFGDRKELIKHLV